MADQNATKVTIEAGEQVFEFAVTIKDYNAYMNEFLLNNKVAPSENFLMRCLKNPEQREDLEALFDKGLSINLAQLVSGEFTPEIEIKVKK